MMAKDQLIRILNDAVQIGTKDIHFTLEETGCISILLRSGNLALPYLLITPKTYKEMLGYINRHTTFEPFNKGQPQSGIMTISDFQNIFECSVSILPTSRFKSLALRIKTPKVQSNKPLKKYLEIIGALSLN